MYVDFHGARSWCFVCWEQAKETCSKYYHLFFRLHLIMGATTFKVPCPRGTGDFPIVKQLLL